MAHKGIATILLLVFAVTAAAGATIPISQAKAADDGTTVEVAGE